MKRLAMVGLMFMMACTRVVDLQVPAGPRRLVVEARFEQLINVFGMQNVQAVTLSTTTDYFNGGAPPAAHLAVVQVKDDLGRTTIFTESSVAGRYLAPPSFRIQRGRTYTLSITFEGQQYRATESTIDVSFIRSVYYSGPSPGRYAGQGGLRATIDYDDPANSRNFYMWEQYVNGVLQLGPDSVTKMRVIANDQLSDGLSVIGFQPYEGVHVTDRDVTLMRQIGISEAAYQYFFALNDQVSANGSPFAVAPASVRGNIQNLTTPSMPALGYFYVSQVAEAELLVLGLRGQ